jgi:hypothetical protein
MRHILCDYIELADRSGLSEAGEFAESFKDAVLYSESYNSAGIEGGGEMIAIPLSVPGGVMVEIEDGPPPVPGMWEEPPPGNRDTDVPTIALTFDGQDEPCKVLLTWKQARALALAIGEVETIARLG